MYLSSKELQCTPQGIFVHSNGTEYKLSRLYAEKSGQLYTYVTMMSIPCPKCSQYVMCGPFMQCSKCGYDFKSRPGRRR